MATETVKSASVTALDATPVGRVAAGRGAEGFLQHIGDWNLVPASASTGSKFFMVRIPTNAKVKSVFFEAEAMGAGKFDVGVWYGPDSASEALRGTVIDQDFFGSVIDAASAVARTDITNEGGFYSVNERVMPLWQALGLSADPLGHFDIIAAVMTTAVTTGAARIGTEVQYVM